MDTPQGVRSGSSVIENTAHESNGLNGSSVHSELHGEAVAVDLPVGGTLFALLKSKDRPAPFAGASYMQILPDSISKNADWRVFHDAIGRQTAIAEVPPEHYPILVTFSDINDPASVKLVDPADLAASFGPSVRLKRITVEITDDPVTIGIEKRFGWWEKYRELHFDGTPSRYNDLTKTDLKAHMSSSSFST